MILGIDASNIRVGGGITHLVEFLGVAKPQEHGFEKIILWGNSKTLSRVEERDWLIKDPHPILNKNLIYRAFWQKFILTKVAKTNKCSIVFIPGGSYAGEFHPIVAMSRNMLPFEWRELLRYGWSLQVVKMILLRLVQTYTFRKADGVIFLTEYAKSSVNAVLKLNERKSIIIPHGINKRFKSTPKPQKPIEEYSILKPYRILYVSIIEMYKHQWNVAEAVMNLRNMGFPVILELVGASYGPALKKLDKVLLKANSECKVVDYLGAVQHSELHKLYLDADLCVFASSCENMPNILLEGMAAGLPIACSKLGPMPEVLKDSGLYFDPTCPLDITSVVRKLIENPTLRMTYAKSAFERVNQYSWERCASETLGFLSKVKDTYTRY